MLTLFLARHGQTSHSRENALCGSLDIPLTAEGDRMAVALAEEYSHLPFKAIFSSPMIRAVKTAQPLADRLKVPVQTDPGLVEPGARTPMWWVLPAARRATRSPPAPPLPSTAFAPWCPTAT